VVGERASGSSHPHAPAQGDCLECHTTHASDHIAQLKSDPRVLCSSCHQEQEQIAMNAAFKHPIVLDGRACLNCHLPHGSERKGLLAADPVGACLKCHANPINGPDGTVKVAGVSELAQEGHFVHGPIRNGDCRACHMVHGGPHADLLIAPYSTAFYQPFSEEAYGLCFACHDRSLVMAESTDRATGFRDGTRNLHFLHVNRDPDGRSCRSCHATHAGPTGSLIAESVQFGQWKLPLNFITTDTGGSCAPGCHQAATYTRPAVPPPPPARIPHANPPPPG
jgi:predicted CXXCH cytochrome family protein